MALPDEKEWYIEAPWGRLSIVAWGSCLDPPVLVCHGVLDSAVGWRPLIQLLPKKFYYIGIELPGNGRSDAFPPGMMISMFDMVYPLEVVRKHFRWDQFVFMAHSAAATIGRLYNMAYPGKMSKVVELDQITPSLTVAPDKFAEWYDTFFTKYYEKYDLFNSPIENGPAYTWDEAISKLQQNRGLPQDIARATVARCSEAAANGLIRFTFDQRTKLITRPPFSPSQLKSLYVAMTTPTLAVISNKSASRGLFKNTPYLLDDKAFNGNYKVVIVEGSHDVHVINPERVAPFVEQFLIYGIDGVVNNAKL